MPGPTQLTLDIFFTDAAGYALAAQVAGARPPPPSPRLYGVPAGSVQRYLLPVAPGASSSALPRRDLRRHPGDGDVYGAQQHAPLLEVRL